MNDHIPVEDFAAYIDGMLSTEKKNELENHFSQCPVCLDELLEIAEIMSSRAKIPAQFIKHALEEKNKIAKPVLHLRHVFEIAAALIVVVFIGYLFLGNNRFWQTPEQQKPSIIMEKDLHPADTFTSLRDDKIAPLPAKKRERADASKANNERFKTDTDQRLADSLVSEKRKSVVGDKGIQAAMTRSRQTRAKENKLQETAAKQPQSVTEKENLNKKRFTRTAEVPETVGAVPMDFAAKDQTAAKVMEKKAGEVPSPPVRIEGDIAWTDLRNPELLFAWFWFPKGFALELQIDGAGTVTAVVPLGKFDQPLARQAESEVKKLLFSVSKKNSRRARLVVNELPPSPR